MSSNIFLLLMKVQVLWLTCGYYHNEKRGKLEADIIDLVPCLFHIAAVLAMILF